MEMVKIKFTTRSPLCQIDTSRVEDGKSRILIKKLKVNVKNSLGQNIVAETPVYTANGFRGALRREAFAIFLEAIAKKGLKNKSGTVMSDINFHLHNAGGGNLHQTQPFEIVDEVRELNPLISLFGASLAVEGKLKVSNLIPFIIDDNGEEQYYLRETKDGNWMYSPIVGDVTLIKRDGLLIRDENSRYMTVEQIREWQEKNLENLKNRRDARDDKTKDKVKKETIASMIDREYVCEGVDFYGNISFKSSLTDIEKGLLYKALERLSMRSLGSGASNDLGRVDYHINFDDESDYETKHDKFGDIDKMKRYSPTVQKCFEALDDFLAKIELKNIEMDEILVRKKP